MPDAHDNQARGEKIKPPRGSVLTPLVNSGTFHSADEWMAMHRRHQELVNGDSYELLLLGDSILYGWNWPGRPEIWQQCFGSWRTANLAISGDYLQHLLWRLENGNWAELRPRTIMLLIGANNLDEYEPIEIVKGTMKILNRLRRGCPDAKIWLNGLFPRGRSPGDPIREKIALINQRLALLVEPEQVRFDNPGLELLEADGSMTRKMFYDWCHPNIEGYRRWADHLLAADFPAWIFS